MEIFTQDKLFIEQRAWEHTTALQKPHARAAEVRLHPQREKENNFSKKPEDFTHSLHSTDLLLQPVNFSQAPDTFSDPAARAKGIQHLSPVERLKQLGNGFLWFVPGLMFTFFHDPFGIALAIDAITAGAPHVFGAGLLLKSFNGFNAFWRGYLSSKRNGNGHRVKYHGEGYPHSSVTYAVENIRGFYKEQGPVGGFVKRSFSFLFVLPASFIATVLGHGLKNSFRTIKGIWKSNGHHVPVISEIQNTVVSALALVPTLVFGMLKGMWFWGEEFADGLKRQKDTSVQVA